MFLVGIFRNKTSPKISKRWKLARYSLSPNRSSSPTIIITSVVDAPCIFSFKLTVKQGGVQDISMFPSRFNLSPLHHLEQLISCRSFLVTKDVHLINFPPKFTKLLCDLLPEEVTIMNIYIYIFIFDSDKFVIVYYFLLPRWDVL